MTNSIQVDAYVLRDPPKETIYYVQGTNAVDMVFHFRDFQIPSGAAAKIYAHKPSQKAVYNTASISGNGVVVDVTDQMFAETGLTKIQVQITHGDDTLVTFVQPVQVRKNYVDGNASESENQSDFLDEYIRDMEEATSAANEAAESANNAAAAANEAADAIEGAVGSVINDAQKSDVTTYSSNKIENLLGDVTDDLENCYKRSEEITEENIDAIIAGTYDPDSDTGAFDPSGGGEGGVLDEITESEINEIIAGLF